MLQFLVSSKVRRRLLLLLWVDGEEGTATQLAARAHVSFASAYRELRAMNRWQLVTTGRTRDGLVYAANRAHPDADALTKVFRPGPRVIVDERAQALRAQLAESGAPLRSIAPSGKRLAIDVLVAEGVELARRDAEVARTLPVLIYKHRDVIDIVARSPAVRPVAHRLGFFLALTARLSGESRFDRVAATLRDRRVKRQDLFDGASSSSAGARAFRLAHAWGFRMRADLGWFQTLFDRFVRR